MGLLDSSGNVISVDAVLTDVGRTFLAANDGRFEIVRFALGDDEINYNFFNANTGSIQQDNNILNTPVFEACVNEKIAQKYQLISISNPNLQYLPTLAPSVTSLALGERTNSQVGQTISFNQTTQAGRVVPSEIVDGSFTIQVNSSLLYIQNQVPVNVSGYGTAQYVLPRTSIAANQGAQIAFALAVQALPNQVWSTFGIGTIGSRTISTTIRCFGSLSGLISEVAITINEEFTRSS